MTENKRIPPLCQPLPDIGRVDPAPCPWSSRWLTNHYVELDFATVIGTGIFFSARSYQAAAARYIRNQIAD